MNTEDIIRMAREADMPINWISDEGVLRWSDLENFAALVAAAEREACAKVCEDLEGLFFNLHQVGFENQNLNTVAVRKIIRDTALVAIEDCYEAIRARGQK